MTKAETYTVTFDEQRHTGFLSLKDAVHFYAENRPKAKHIAGIDCVARHGAVKRIVGELGWSGELGVFQDWREFKPTKRVKEMIDFEIERDWFTHGYAPNKNHTVS
jgi:hypothetical protein